MREHFKVMIEVDNSPHYQGMRSEYLRDVAQALVVAARSITPVMYVMVVDPMDRYTDTGF